MEATDYIDGDGREFPDASSSAAVNECVNCGRTCETLHHVPEFDFMGCGDCLDEAMEIIAGGAREQVQPSKFTVVERHNGQKWIEVRLEWNGTEYQEVA
jgi:hypothetical protein